MEKEKAMQFQGFAEVPVRFNDGCRASDEEKKGVVMTDDQYDEAVKEVTSLTKHKLMRSYFYFHPILVIFFAPLRDGFTGGRRAFVLSVGYGVGLLISCLVRAATGWHIIFHFKPSKVN